MNPFVWDASTGRYRWPNGRFASKKEVRDAIDAALDNEIKRSRELGLALREGRVSLSVWRLEMREMIKSVHLYSAALAKGGWAQLTQSDYGTVGNIVRHEYRFLERFVTGLNNGRVAMDGNFFDRARMYAEAGRDTYHQVERAIMKAAGYVYESNVLHPAEHCAVCVEQRDRGRVPIGELIAIGRRTCLRKCRCSLAYWKTLVEA